MYCNNKNVLFYFYFKTIYVVIFEHNNKNNSFFLTKMFLYMFRVLREMNSRKKISVYFPISFFKRLHVMIFISVFHFFYSFKRSIKKWQISTAEEKAIINLRKTEIRHAVRNLIVILLDIPKAGFGNTNNGNTSRRFFSGPEPVSRFTPIDSIWSTNSKWY